MNDLNLSVFAAFNIINDYIENTETNLIVFEEFKNQYKILLLLDMLDNYIDITLITSPQNYCIIRNQLKITERIDDFSELIIRYRNIKSNNIDLYKEIDELLSYDEKLDLLQLIFILGKTISISDELTSSSAYKLKCKKHDYLMLKNSIN